MAQITELTDQQIAEAGNYREKYIKIGLNTNRVTPAVFPAVRQFYTHILERKEPKQIIIMPTPLHAWIATCILNGQPEQICRFVYPYMDGAWWSSFIGFYDFCAEILGVVYQQETRERYNIVKELVLKADYVFPLDDYCILSDRPTKILLNEAGQLHSENEAAVQYTDSAFAVYALNGIRVPAWVVETPAEKITAKQILDEKNTDVQREIIRKVGYERVLKLCNAKTVETWDCPKTDLHYEMKIMDIGNISRRYLCYEHASMPGIYYAKCCPPEADSIMKMRGFQTGVFGFNPQTARENLRKSQLTDSEILALLPESVQ